MNIKQSLTLLSVISLFLFSCTKESTTDDTVPTNTSANDFAASFTVDGTPVSFKDLVNASQIPSAAYLVKAVKLDTVVTGTDTAVFQTIKISSSYTITFSSRTSAVKLMISTDSAAYVAKNDSSVLYINGALNKVYPIDSNFKINRIPADAFYDIFKQPAYTLGSSTTNGYVITYIDETGKVWKSNKGVPTGSISVNMGENAVYGDGLEYVKGTLTFGCTVYNGTDSKTISNGSLSGIFINSR